MSSLARWCFVHRRIVVGFWLLALIVVVGEGVHAGSAFNSNFNLPNTDSQAAVTLLQRDFPSAAGEGDEIVFQSIAGTTVHNPQVQAAVGDALDRVSKVAGVRSVSSPYGRGNSEQISRSGTVAFATVTWAKPSNKVTDADAGRLMSAARIPEDAPLHVFFSGSSISSKETAGPGLSEAVAVIAALIILLLVFGGALFASIMPLLTAALALVIGTSVIGLMTHAFDVAHVSSDLAVLIGLGVGVDYGLFIISRHRSAVKSGASYADAAVEAVSTSGRTVLFAGITVCIALLGQFALGVSFLYGLASASAIAVALTMATSLTFLPAMLGFLGPKVLSRRERAALALHGPSQVRPGAVSRGWAKLVARVPRFAAAASLAVLVVIAIPVLSLRLGSSDGSTDPSGSTTHKAYVALKEGFGPGLTGPLELATTVSSRADTAAFTALVDRVRSTRGVAAVSSPVLSPGRDAMLAVVYPTTSPQDRHTVDLVNRLRHDVIPGAERGTGLQVHVGGQTATDIDFSHVLAQKLPLFIAVVVVLAFLLLMMVFRSVLIPAVAAVMNLLSAGAALGGLNAVFNWGWADKYLGLSGTGPIDAFIPVLLFSVLFGLSMDYEVFLVSRMQEEWQHLNGRDASTVTSRELDARNRQAVGGGQAKSGRVIVAAAAIMVLVFASFLLNGSRLLQEFGFGLSFAVLVDALVIRCVLVPALMHVTGPRNWHLPRALGRLLPNLSVEAPSAPVDGFVQPHTPAPVR